MKNFKNKVRSIISNNTFGQTIVMLFFLILLASLYFAHVKQMAEIGILILEIGIGSLASIATLAMIIYGIFDNENK